MRKPIIYTAIFFALLLASCNNAHHSAPGQYGTPIQQPADILNDDANFANYYYGLKLSRDFIALDTNSTTINKADFLQRVATGKYLPVQVTAEDSALCYKLYSVTGHADVMGSIQQLARWEYTHYQMEGKPVPGFNYTDINGNKYNPQTTKDKIVVLKCWFIHCLKCNEEIPALNNLVDSYKNRNDVVFVSLAFDDEKDLKKFVAKKTFKYAVASVKEDYMEKELGITEYPTHIIVNKKGRIVKMVSDYEELEQVLNKER